MLTRRGFLKLGLLSGLDLSFPISAVCNTNEEKREQLLVTADYLLSEWCQGLLRYQVSKPDDPRQNGGIWSPADRRIMGRCGDAVYPLLWCADRHQDDRFLDAALKVMTWSMTNVALPDGSWKNGIHEKWTGITVFIAISMAQALMKHGRILEKTVHDSWLDRMYLSGQWLYKTININYSNINYPASNAYAMALLGKLLDEPKYLLKSRELAHGLLNWFTPKDKLLFGEGRGNKSYPDNISPKGCYPVDLGYNVEESLPAMVLYGLLQHDEEVLDAVTQSLRVHLEFMLPDGGWDNSWGTRNYKWTWWGGRTSDGCQPAYALLADRDPAFLEAACRNTMLLQNCTHKGILYGGPDYYHHGAKPSIHHTFCHAKALATVLDHDLPEPHQPSTHLPCQSEYGLRSFSDIDTHLVSLGPWRATVTGYDFPYQQWVTGHATGGALSLLWHRDVGLLISASLNVYRLIEPDDMQKDLGIEIEPLTPRLELKPKPPLYSKIVNQVFDDKIAEKYYTNIIDYNAVINTSLEPGVITITTHSSLVDENLQPPETGKIGCTIRYQFTHENLKIEVTIDKPVKDKTLNFVIPVISRSTEPAKKYSDGSVRIMKNKNFVSVTSDQEIKIPEKIQSRQFNYVPGLEALPLSIMVEDKITVQVEVKNQ